MRRISSYLYSRNKRYEDAIELSKKDKLYKDAMTTASASGDAAICQKLLRHFVEIKQYEVKKKFFLFFLLNRINFIFLISASLHALSTATILLLQTLCW